MFDKSTRTLMAMLFQRGLVTTIDGVVPGTERKFYIYRYDPKLFRDGPMFTGFISGLYTEDYAGATLDETLDKMETYIDRLALEEMLLGETLEMEVAVL